MRRLTITAERVGDATAPAPYDPLVVTSPTGEQYRLSGDPEAPGLDQIAAFARAVASETGDPVVYVEVFWPWETEEAQTWDALRVDTALIGDGSPGTWVETLPPYAELTPEQRAALGIEAAP